MICKEWVIKVSMEIYGQSYRFLSKKQFGELGGDPKREVMQVRGSLEIDRMKTRKSGRRDHRQFQRLKRYILVNAPTYSSVLHSAEVHTYSRQTRSRRLLAMSVQRPFL